MARSKVLVRYRREDRERLAGKTPAELAANVVGIGQQMERDAYQRDTLRKTIGLPRENEARMLAHSHAELRAIVDELRLRIDHLLAGKDIGS